MEKLDQFFALVAQYGKDLTILGVIFGAILALIGVIMNIVFNRRNKRDELRYGSLLSLRNAEMKNYISAIANLMTLLQDTTSLLIEDKTRLIKHRDALFEARSLFGKSELFLTFLLTVKDAKELAPLSAEVREMAANGIQLVTNNIRKEKVDILEASKELDKFAESLDPLIKQLKQVVPSFQTMVRKYNGVK